MWWTTGHWHVITLNVQWLQLCCSFGLIIIRKQPLECRDPEAAV